ncbi:MAG: hypothetical protein LBH48_04765, partial [Bifidobacteriaceae bacterium]|nr:hypothetical protein [Bifidobacteriaceae bacterium]
MSLRQALDQATARLASAGIADPRLDAELLAAHIWDVSPGRLRALIHTDPADGDSPRLARLAAAVARRAERVPLQHITGRAPFRHLELEVGPGVFIPRPETEVTAELAIQAARAFQGAAAGHLGGAAPGGRAGQVGGAEPVSAAGPVRVVDLGTGSGAIAAAVATEVPGAEVWAIESQPEAHSWAARNLANLPVHLLLA